MNELLQLIKAFNKDKDVKVTIHYYSTLDAYEIEMREYNYEYYFADEMGHHYGRYHSVKHVVKLIRANDLLSAKIPTNEAFVKVLNEMYEQLKGRTSCQKS